MQQRSSVNACYGVLGSNEARLTAPYYRYVFENSIISHIEKMCFLIHKDDCGYIIMNTSTCRERGNRIVTEKYTAKWIGTNGPVAWPAPSPDVNP